MSMIVKSNMIYYYQLSFSRIQHYKESTVKHDQA